MNFRKVLMKVTMVLAGLLVLAMIGLTVYQNHLIKRANREASMGNETGSGVPEDSSGSGAPGDMGTDVERDEVDALKRQLDTAEEELGMTQEELLAERERQEELKRQRIEFQRKMLEDPAIRESIRSGLEAQYKSLFEVLALSSDQQEKLKEILTNSAMSYIKLNPEILAAATDEEKTMLQQRYDYLREETRLRIEALLGHEAYDKYQAYEDRSISRSVVSGFSDSLPPDNGLTEKQKHELIEIMYGEAQEVFEDIGYDPTALLEFPSDMDTENISKRMNVTDRVLFNSAENSWSILSESQLEAYNDYLRNYSEQVEMSLVMMRQEYGE